MTRKRSNPTSPYVPSGLIAKTEKGYFYVKGSKRFKFISDRAVKSWGLKIVHTTEIDLKKTEVCGNIGFRDGSLIRDISNQKIFLISDNKKRHIVSPDILKQLGYLKDEIVLVSSKEAGYHAEGDKLDG